MHLSPVPHPRRVAVAAVTAAGLLLAGCGSGDQQSGKAAASKPSDNSPYHATQLGTPFKKPDLTLQDTSGKPYNLREETKGTTTLLYFGYTHCPDVCPTTMADIAAAKHQLSKKQQNNMKVVFVTTDPKRDTPKEMRPWLDAFDSDFVGLSGDFTTIQHAAKKVGISIEPPKKDKEGHITVQHGAQTLAFAPGDNRAHVVFMSRSKPQDYAHDLPLLMRDVPADGRSPEHRQHTKHRSSADDEGDNAARGAKKTPPKLSVSDSYVPKPASKKMAAGYLRIRNTGGTADRLTRASSPDAKRVELHRTSGQEMRQVTGFKVPAHGSLKLSRSHNHLMIIGPKKKLTAGKKITVELTFARSGKITETLPVKPIDYRPEGATK